MISPGWLTTTDVTRMEETLVPNMEKTIMGVHMEHNPMTGRLD